ncbi:uncharacterized protein G2W53_012097 [Senna tora]|uniref:Uncharacterized protein n=1 Tax=Senna tora TaxID=362788 RepID=A0A834TXI5_9FABA|nr:uncharacterized protein G2W53_012097 [Senna tora]
MASSRRPARFERKISVSEAINPKKLELIRAAAARVYINNQEKPGENSNMCEAEEAEKGGAGIEIENTEEADHQDQDHGINLLAAVAIQLARQETKHEDSITIRATKNKANNN